LAAHAMVLAEQCPGINQGNSGSRSI
jgi:hypothetical protein